MNRRKLIINFTISCFVLVLFCSISIAGLHDKIEQRQKDSENLNATANELQKAKPFTVPMSYDKTWDIIVGVLKDKGLPIDKANKDIGQLKTEFQITNASKPRQHGMRYVIDMKRLSDSQTEVKVCAMEQVRYNVLQADPWEEPSYNAETSDALSKAIVDASSK
jgi:uncharacterized lipoprotein